ncbi:MAG: peptide chain release factor N(5)-glutamine methyltransferase [Candidatus Latescibacteria bacterium]|nr:peptide chain release factor N(5)-glutamine methyltransferase [Candidatus Latescibacterota bacterium]
MSSPEKIAAPAEGRAAGSLASPHVTRAILLAEARETLVQAGVESAAHDAEALLLHALSIGRAELWASPGESPGREEAERFARLIEARARRIPLQILIGEVPFHGAAILVEPGVFIPRPETEVLVERALEALRPIPGRGSILELGVGTGAISIALLLALPSGWTALAIDRSEAACALAERNATRNGVAERMAVARGDFRGVDRDAAALGHEGGGASRRGTAAPATNAPAPADLLVSNPPYVPSGRVATLMPEVRDHDPREALDGGADGLDSLRAVARGLPARLRPGGVLALEIGEDQADASLELFGAFLEGARVLSDLTGKPRVLIGRMRG